MVGLVVVGGEERDEHVQLVVGMLCNYGIAHINYQDSPLFHDYSAVLYKICSYDAIVEKTRSVMRYPAAEEFTIYRDGAAVTVYLSPISKPSEIAYVVRDKTWTRDLRCK